MKPASKTLLSFLSSLSLIVCLSSNHVKADTMKTCFDNTPDIRQEKIVPIAAFTANGDLSGLKPALHDGLDHGLTISEIREVLIQLYAYAGFPRSLNAIQTFMDVLAERQQQHIADPAGDDPESLPPGTDRNAYGEKVRMQLAGQSEPPPAAPYQLFAPGIDTFLKEHLFADIFSRGVLNYAEREIATVSALAAMPGTQAQLRFHIGAAMNAGVCPDTMETVLSILHEKIDRTQAETASAIYKKLLEKKMEKQ